MGEGKGPRLTKQPVSLWTAPITLSPSLHSVHHHQMLFFAQQPHTCLQNSKLLPCEESHTGYMRSVLTQKPLHSPGAVRFHRHGLQGPLKRCAQFQKSLCLGKSKGIQSVCKTLSQSRCIFPVWDHFYGNVVQKYKYSLSLLAFPETKISKLKLKFSYRKKLILYLLPLKSSANKEEYVHSINYGKSLIKYSVNNIHSIVLFQNNLKNFIL